MNREEREYLSQFFYDLCYEDDDENEFILDIICLNCRMRIGAHGYGEFVQCALEYVGDANE